MNWIHRSMLAAAALAAACATGCSGPTLSGPARLVYHSTGAKGQRGNYEPMRLTFVNKTNPKYVGEAGEPLVEDDSLKVIPDALMADLLTRLDDHGYATHAQPGDVDQALQAGAAEVIQVDRGDRQTILVKPKPPLRTEADRERVRAFVAMKQEILEVHARRTQFHVVGKGQRRPSWAPAPK